jgi:hypothetical protein
LVLSLSLSQLSRPSLSRNQGAPTQRVRRPRSELATRMSKRARDEDASLPQQPRRKRLGASGIEVCEVCLGTMTFGSMTADEPTCHQILDRYIALGGNFIDTARAAPNPDAKPKATPKPEQNPEPKPKPHPDPSPCRLRCTRCLAWRSGSAAPKRSLASGSQGAPTARAW